MPRKIIERPLVRPSPSGCSHCFQRASTCSGTVSSEKILDKNETVIKEDGKALGGECNLQKAVDVLI